MPIKISIPLQGNGRIEVEGDLQYVKETIPHLKELVEALGVNVGEVSIAPVTIGNELDSVDERIPTIPPDVKTSPSEAIQYLFTEGNWGLKPRKIGEIKEALSAEGINRDSKFVAAILVQLVKAGKLHRIKDKSLNQWVYSRY
jgi:hypothetical protein